MTAYYNEIDPYAAQWLRNLIAAGHIAPGDVDERSIVDVRPDDLAGYRQCHFFAGIGGWSYAAKLAGWEDERPLWTGSCPCQPFSVAGNQAGFDDARHLWPQFRRLIAERRPATVFGEQVAGASDWLRLVRSDLETLDYAVGAIPVEAASAGADHFRDRYWFVADCHGQRSQIPIGQSSDAGAQQQAAEGSRLRHVGDMSSERGYWGENTPEQAGRFSAQIADISGLYYLECSDGKWRRLPPPRVRWLGTGIPARVAKLRAFGNSIDPRPASQFIASYMECRP
jgi:DNA (cytosine-5)-methyltransferase 1